MVAGVAGPAARELAAEVLKRLTEAGHTLATAESLTGGLVAAALTDVPGASSAFRGGVVAYATELKAEALGVDVAMLKAHGPVYARWRRRWPRASGGACRPRSEWRPPELLALTPRMAIPPARCTSR
jgi:hypothetical protein